MSPIIGIIDSQKSGHLTNPAFYSIATATPSGTNTVTFSGIPSTYRYLEIRGIAANQLGSDSDISMNMRFNGDTGNNYVSNRMTYDAATVSGTQADWSGLSPATSVNSGLCNNGGGNSFAFNIWRIYDYSNTNKNTTTLCICGDAQNNGGAGIRNTYVNSSVWLNTTTVNSITILLTTSNFVSGTQLALYGVK